MSTRWERTPDRRTWCASIGSSVLTACKLSTGMWRATVSDARSPEFGTRLAAQRWAENHAAGEK